MQPATQQYLFTGVLREFTGSYAIHWSPPSSYVDGETVVPPHFTRLAASLVKSDNGDDRRVLPGPSSTLPALQGVRH